MKICFIDESGDGSDIHSANDTNQPVLTIAGLIFDYSQLHILTHELLNLKRRFFPNLPPNSGHYLDSILSEIKGSELRRNIAQGGKRKRRHAMGFIRKTLAALKASDAKLIARVWVKEIGVQFRDKAVYTSSIQSICAGFQNYLEDTDDLGMVVADSRTKSLNANVAHSIFTQKFRSSDAYDRIVELPTFGHSDNHVGLQYADLFCSALLFPIASFAYCSGHVNNVHVHPGYRRLRDEFGSDLKDFQYRYQEASGRYLGGVTVSDPLNCWNATRMFR